MSDETPSDETPSDENPSNEILAEETPAPEAPTVETTTPDGAPVAAADPVPVEPARAPVAAASETKRKGVFVPAWAGAIMLVLVVAAAGFGVGRWTADDSTTNSTAIANNGGIVPQPPIGNGTGNSGNGSTGNGNRGGQTTPSTPATGAAFLGVEPQDATGGVAVVSVGANSPAAKAGLKAGDAITAIDNTSVTTATALRSAIQSHDPGDTVTVHFTRAGQATTVKVTLATQSQ